MNQLDHIVIAAANLDQAVESFAQQTGCTPQLGGAHQGLGTHNALVSFGDHSYLEIIAPDPAQQPTAGFSRALAQLSQPQVLHWAIRSDDLGAVANRVREIGLSAGPIRDTSRVQTDGNVLAWQLMGIGGHELAGLVPFYIDWLDCPHPADTAPVVGSLLTCTVTTPASSLLALQELVSTIDSVTVKSGAAHFEFSFESANGNIEYASSLLRGFPL
jgi:hypothetical protein